MPEGDTVWRTARRLTAALAGAPLTRLEVRWGDYGDWNGLPASTLEVVSRGKHLLHHLDTGVTVHTHLRMEGSWRLLGSGKVTETHLHNPQIRVLVATNNWTAFGLRLGMVDIWPTSEVSGRLAHLGPDLLGPDWDLDVAMGNLCADPAAEIGLALLDQRTMAGIGTFWASEGLFLGGHSPWTAVGDLTEGQVTQLVTGIRRLMRQAAQSAVQSSTGRTRNGETAYVHARSGSPCRRCGAMVRVAPLGRPPADRVFFYCPTCQGGLAPTDDGAQQSPLGSARRRGALRRPTPKLRRREA